MRSKGIHLSLVLVASLGIISLTGCGGGDNDSARLAQTVDASKNTVTRVALTEKDVTVHVQGTHQFKLEGMDSEGKVVADLTSKASWKLSDSSLGKIKNGLFEGKNKKGDTGEVKLVASYAGLSEEIIVKLSDANLIGVTVSHASPNASVDVCKNTSFKASTSFSDSGTYDYPLTWKITGSEPANIASFASASSPELSTKKSGVIKVVATGLDNSKKEVLSPEFEFNISPNLTDITLTPSDTLTLRQGQKATLKVVGSYRDGSTETITKNASITSSNTSALTVNSSTGELTAVSGSAAGTDVTVSANCDSVTKTLTVKVTKPDMLKMEIVGQTSTTATETLSVSLGASVEPRIKVTYPAAASLDPEIYSGSNTEWTITNTPTGYDESKVTLNAVTGKVTVDSSMVLSSSITVTLNARLFDKDNKTIVGTDGSELKDSIQLTINR
jgi:hypothetical protein